MNNPEVAKLIKQLKHKKQYVRYYAAIALGKIGNANAVPALIGALKDKDWSVRLKAAEALGKIGASAVPALIGALKDENEYVRGHAAEALGKIGYAEAVPALIESLKDKEEYVRSNATEALEKIGDSYTMPRKILAAFQFSAREQIKILEMLRRGRYKDGSGVVVRYSIPDTRTLCQTILSEDDTEARRGAQTVLNWLNGDSTLLRASQRDEPTERQELLRAAEGGTPEQHPETLLIAASKPQENTEEAPRRLTFRERLFGKRANSSS